jgi:hypothetical protein
LLEHQALGEISTEHYDKTSDVNVRGVISRSTRRCICFVAPLVLS